MITSMNIVTYVLVVSAGLLAFIVLYNLNNINISERQRELATLKVLGFYDGEISMYVFRENIMLTVLGTIFGIFFGIWLHRFVILTAELDIMMFGRQIYTKSYIYSILLTIGFSIIVNIVMHWKMKKIDMIELFKEGVERENLNIKNIDITFFTIVELVGSTCFSCIVNKIPCSIEEYKPYLYDLIRTLLHAA